MKRHVLIFRRNRCPSDYRPQAIDYQFLVIEHSIEIYVGLIAAIFALLGIWLGIKLTGFRNGPV